MNTDLNTILALKRDFDICADHLREAKRKMIHHRNHLDAVWNAHEISIIDGVIDEIDRKLERMAEELNDIAVDILKAYQQIEDVGAKK